MAPLMIEVKVVRIEHRHVHQALEVENPELLAVELDQPVAPQVLERPVDVNRRQAGRVRKVVLGKRKVAPPILSPADSAEADVELDQQVSEPLVGAALAQVQRPFALDR